MKENLFKLRIVLFCLWAAAVISVVFALFNQEKFFAANVRPLATLRFHQGDVFVRSFNSVKWIESYDGQKLFDGDFISTGPRTKSQVNFDAGRSLELSENTQIQVTSILDQSGKLTFKISLGRGAIVARSESCKTCGSLILRSGSETYNVARDKNFGLFKQPGKKSEKFDVNGPIPNLNIQRNEESKIEVNLIAQSTIEKVDAKPAPKHPVSIKTQTDTGNSRLLDLVDLRGKELDIGGPALGRVWWVYDQFHSISGQFIEVPIVVPKIEKSRAKWRQVIEISGREGASEVIFVDNVAIAKNAVQIPIEKIQAVVASYRNQLYSEHVFSLRGGVEIEIDGEPKKLSWRSRKVFFRIREFHALYTGPVTIALDRFDQSQNRTFIFDEKKEENINDAPIVIHLENGSHFSNFLPIFKNANLIKVSLGPLDNEKGVFLVDKTIVAQIFGRKLENQVIVEVLSMLGADLAFRGKKSAFSVAQDGNPGGLVNKVGTLLDKGQVVYVLKRNKIYPVSRDFIKSNGDVAKFVDKHAKAVFLEDVEIVATR